MSEASWVARSRAGDFDAFNQLVLRYQNLAYRLAFYLLYNEDAAVEVVHDSFVRAFKALDTLQLSSFRNMLMRIVADNSCDVLRKQQSCPTASTEVLRVARCQRMLSDGTSHFAEKVTKRTEVREQLAAGIQSLPFNQRVALALSDICGFSYVEIDDICGVAPGTARIYLSQARGRLRDYLIQDEDVSSRESKLH